MGDSAIVYRHAFLGGRLTQEYAVETLGAGSVNQQALTGSNQTCLDNSNHQFQAAANYRDTVHGGSGLLSFTQF